MSCALPKTLPGTCRRWPLTLRSWRTSCTCSASCAVGARRSGRVRIGRTAPGATSASTRPFCSTSTARAEGACGPRCSVWWQPRTGSGGSRPRHAGWLVDSRRTGAAAGSPAELVAVAVSTAVAGAWTRARTLRILGLPRSEESRGRPGDQVGTGSKPVVRAARRRLLSSSPRANGPTLPPSVGPPMFCAHVFGRGRSVDAFGRHRSGRWAVRGR
jgi:hypothetical protein